jgi:hypothetical protein
MSKFTEDEARAFERIMAGFSGSPRPDLDSDDDDENDLINGINRAARVTFRSEREAMSIIECDLCTREVNTKNAYVSWWVDANLKTLKVWLTCQPHECFLTRKLQQPPKGLILMDHHARSIAARFESWAKDYQINGETVASVAVRLSTLLATRKP